MLIKAIIEETKLQNACKSECLLKWYAYTDFQMLKG